jgi:hypothetical protein
MMRFGVSYAQPTYDSSRGEGNGARPSSSSGATRIPMTPSSPEGQSIKESSCKGADYDLEGSQFMS